MKKKIFLLLGLLSTTVFAQNNFLLFANNGLALNGIHSSDFAQDFAIKNRVNSNNQIKFNFTYNNETISIDLSSHTQYTVKTKDSIFVYKSDTTNFTNKFLDRLSNRTIVFDVQNIGDYLLFSEDRKITCFNLKNSKPCSNYIEKHTTSLPQNGMPQILLKNLYFYENKTKNEIFQCLNGIAFLKDKEYAQSCDGKTTINLETLN